MTTWVSALQATVDSPAERARLKAKLAELDAREERRMFHKAGMPGRHRPGGGFYGCRCPECSR